MASAAITIEKNVPFPDEARGRKSVYPFAEMQVGDSFSVPAKGSRVSAAACMRGKALGYKFTVRKLGDTIRVWRLA